VCKTQFSSLFECRYGVYDSLFAPANPFMLQHMDNATDTGNGQSSKFRMPGQTGRWKSGSESEVGVKTEIYQSRVPFQMVNAR
jgi:hypothetical protein